MNLEEAGGEWNPSGENRNKMAETGQTKSILKLL